jgi:hypothetical protein
MSKNVRSASAYYNSSCIGSYVPTSSISMWHDHIKESSSRFREGKSSPLHQFSLVIESSRFRSWVGSTTNIEEWLERFKRQAVILEEIAFRIPLYFWST